MAAAKSFASPQYYSILVGSGDSAPCVYPLEMPLLCNGFFISSGTIRGEAIRIDRVVVVDIAAGIHIRTFWALAYTPYAFMSCNGFGLIPATFLSLHEHLLYVYPSIRSVML